MGKSLAKESTLHQKILSEIEEKIVAGEWAPGFRLPFEVNLAKHYGCSRMTVNKVMTQLAKAGLVERHRKAGTFVSKPKASSAILELHDIETEVNSLGVPYAYQAISIVARASTADDQRLIETEAGTQLVDILAVHKAGEKPFCVEERRINASIVPEATEADFQVTPPGKWLIAKVPWSVVENRIQAVTASVQMAKLLDVPKGTACLNVERRTWSAAGPITYVRLTYPGDSHTLVARFTPAQSL